MIDLRKDKSSNKINIPGHQPDVEYGLMYNSDTVATQSNYTFSWGTSLTINYWKTPHVNDYTLVIWRIKQLH